MDWDEFGRQDTAIRHAIQTGVAYEQQLEDAAFFDANPKLGLILKHIRTGLNCAMCEYSTMTRLLIQKGVITEAEYFEAALKTSLVSKQSIGALRIGGSARSRVQR